MDISVSVEFGRARNSRSDSGDDYRLTVTDNSSRTRFLELRMTAKQFAEMLTSLHQSDVTAMVRGLDRVGKRRIREGRSAVCPEKFWSREEQEAWLVENCQEEGWILDSHLGSQSSVVHKDGQTVLRYSVFKFVDEQETAND